MGIQTAIGEANKVETTEEKTTKGNNSSIALKMLSVKAKVLRSAYLISDEEYQTIKEIHEKAVIKWMSGGN